MGFDEAGCVWATCLASDFFRLFLGRGLAFVVKLGELGCGRAGMPGQRADQNVLRFVIDVAGLIWTCSVALNLPPRGV